MKKSTKIKPLNTCCDVVQKTSESSGKDKLSLVVLTLVFLGIVGLGVFSYYTFILPNINNLDNSILSLTLAFSFLAGTVVFAAPCPCSIAILPSYMAYYLTTDDHKENFGNAGSCRAHPQTHGRRRAGARTGAHDLVVDVLIRANEEDEFEEFTDGGFPISSISFFRKGRLSHGIA